MAAGALIGFIVGFLGGRESIKYEMRSALRSVFEPVASVKPDPGKIIRERIAKEKRSTYQQISNAFAATFVSKRLTGERRLDQLELVFFFENMSKVAISAVKGSAVFLDPFGDLILKIKITDDETISPGRGREYKGYLDFNQP